MQLPKPENVKLVISVENLLWSMDISEKWSCDTKEKKNLKVLFFIFLSTVEGGKAWRADGFKVEMCIWDASRKWQNCKCFSSLQHLPHHFKHSITFFHTPNELHKRLFHCVLHWFKYIIIAVCSNRLYADWVFSGTCCDRKVVSSNLAESTGTPPSCPNLLFERRQPIKRRLAKTECSVKRWGTKRARFRLDQLFDCAKAKYKMNKKYFNL